jgi:phenylalanyl-tRNA synthetase beta chain
MICSPLELGLGEDHTGIIVLPDDAPVGLPLDQYLGDAILDLEVTPNRLDCLSILGVAHEVAALTGKDVREPEVSYPEAGPPITDAVRVSIADPDLCRRYTASLIRGVTIAPSPHWLQERLVRAGMRPINNVVDVTNYVMLEFNQPLHAFDFDRLDESTIVVRRARAGETLVTLDGVERRLSQEVLVIADSRRPIGVGGVIGGANSEIGPATATVLLESATFNGLNNRQTARLFRLSTEATLRFEKGLRPELAPIALRRATRLIQQVAGGEVARGIVDVYPEGDHPTQPVPLTASRLKKVLGMDIEVDKVERVLRSLGFWTRWRGPESLEVSAPYWRNDIAIEEDLVEEVVRILGYDSVPTTMLATEIPLQREEPLTKLVDLVKDALVAIGLQEVISYPLVGLEALQKVNSLDRARAPLRVSNPLATGQEYLRPTLRASLLETLAANEGHSEGPFRLFEAGRVFYPRDGQLPEEPQMVAGILAGRRWEPSWLEGDGRLDFYDAKGVVEGLLDRLGIPATYEPFDDPALQPGRCAQVWAGNAKLGVVGEVHPAVRQRFGLKTQPVTFFEMSLDALLRVQPPSRRGFASFSRYPTATRDLALVVPSDIPAGRVGGIIGRHQLVTSVELFDIYTGENIPSGAKSLAFHVYFQAFDRTLTAEEVNRSLQGLLRTLEQETGASLRR